MLTQTTRTFRLAPISASEADALRRSDGPRYVADSQPGYPCRQCLRDAEVGDELILVSHDPFTSDSPYRCASPIFLHAEPCEPDADAANVPVQLTARQLSVRAFDGRLMMIDAAVIDGVDLESTIDRFFAHDATTVVHVHNAVRGCWAVNAERAG